MLLKRFFERARTRSSNDTYKRENPIINYETEEEEEEKN